MGAAGKTGRAVLEAVRRRGGGSIGLVRGTPDAGERQVDLLDPTSVRQALRGVTGLYHLAPNVHPDEVRIGRTMLEAAADAGTRRFVFHSVLHPQLEAMPHHWAKLRVEGLVVESGLAWTVLQPAAYAQNFLPAIATGELVVPYDPDARFSLVDLADVAEAAAVVLTEPGHTCATYELAGPRALSVSELADELGIRASRQDVSRWREMQSLPEYAERALTAMFAHYDRHGLVGSPHVLASLLRREPTDPVAALRRDARR